jgi:putative membrane protein
MNDARTALTMEDRGRIAAAICEAEKKTSAEIVCAVATESGRYDRAESIVGLLGSLVALGIAHASAHGFVFGAGEWASPHGVGLGWQCVAAVLGFVTGSVLASYVHTVRAPFVSTRDMSDEVWSAASRVMALNKADEIRSHAAVLVYASLFERRVVVLAGKAAHDALGEEGLRRIRDAALADLRKGNTAGAFAAAVAEAARLCAYSLPPSERNPDELPNLVLVFHPRP